MLGSAWGYGYNYIPDNSIDYGTGLRWNAATGTSSKIGDMIVHTRDEDGNESFTAGVSFDAPADENSAGMIVGWASRRSVSGLSSGPGTHVPAAAVWQNGATVFLSDVYGSYASSINNLSQPLAVGGDVLSSEHRAVLWAKVNNQWKQKDLGPYVPSTKSVAPLYGYAYQINDRCEMIGGFYDSKWNWAGFMQNGKIVDLGSRTSAAYGGFGPIAINNHGAILTYCSRQADGQQIKALLLPVEILDKDKKTVNKLKVAKMVESDVLSGSGSSAVLDIKKDSDRFYFRVIDRSQRGKNPKVRFWTESEDSFYSDNLAVDDKNVIQLHNDPDNPAGLISDSLMLVSDAQDDELAVDGVQDNDPGDRTRRIAIGGTVKFEYLAYKTAATGLADAEGRVPIDKTVKVKFFNCKFGFGTKHYAMTQAEVNSQVLRIKERFAQCGIKVDVTTAPGPDIGTFGNLSDLSVKWNANGTRFFINGIPSDWKDMINATPVASDEIAVYAINSFGSKGDTTVPSYMTTKDLADGYGNKCVIAEQWARPQTSAHEIMHVLLDAEHLDYKEEYGAPPIMLWHDSIWNNSILDTKRIPERQATKCRENKNFAK